MKISDEELALKISRARFDKAIELLRQVEDGKIHPSWISTAIRMLKGYRP